MGQLNVKRLTRETIECSVTRGCGGIAPGRRSALVRCFKCDTETLDHCGIGYPELCVLRTTMLYLESSVRDQTFLEAHLR